jgi:hypothetical protein
MFQGACTEFLHLRPGGRRPESRRSGARTDVRRVSKAAPWLKRLLSLTSGIYFGYIGGNYIIINGPFLGLQQTEARWRPIP